MVHNAFESQAPIVAISLGHDAVLSATHDPAISGAHDPALSAVHDPAQSAVGGGHTPFLSGGHEVADSVLHTAELSGQHDAVLSGAHSVVLSGGHDPAVSGVHPPFLSGLHDAVLSGAHDPTFSVLHDPVISIVHGANLSAAHDPVVSGLHDAAQSAIHDPLQSRIHDPAISGNAHVAALSDLHSQALSGAHAAADSQLHQPITRNAHQANLSAPHEPIASATHLAIESAFHDPTISDFHDPIVSVVHNPLLSGAHNPILSGGHDPAISAVHVPFISALGDSPPIINFNGPGPASAQIRTSQVDSNCGASGLSNADFQLAALDEATSLGLGYGSGAQLATLGDGCLRVIVPTGFSFSDGWDRPPEGVIFDSANSLDGLIPAEVGGELPTQLAGWNIDFVLPGLALDFAAGFNAITYTGLEISAADLAGSLGSKVVAIFRFNSATQRYERFTVGALEFLNSLDQVQTGDGLFIQTSGAFSSTLLNLTPIGGTVDVSLPSGSNLIAYTGAVSLEQLLASSMG